MKKRYILIIIIFLILFPGMVSGSGKKDKSIIIPGNSVALAWIDVQKNLAAGISPALLDLFYTFRDRGLARKPGKSVLDDQLKEMFGIGLEDLETVILSLVSYTMPEQSFPFAFHIKLKQGSREKAQQHIKETLKPAGNNYRGKTYFSLQQGKRKSYFYTAGDDLLFSYDPSIMESMLDVLYGPDSVQDKQTLYTLIKEYKDNPFFCVGYVPSGQGPEGSDTPIPYPFEQVKEFGLTISLDKDIYFLLKARVDSEEFITAVKGNFSLFSMLMLTRNKKAYPILAALIQAIEYEQKGVYALISGRFTEKDVKSLIDLAPLLFMMMK